MRIAFYTGTRPHVQGIYSRLVRWVDVGPFSHVELIFSDGLSGSASFVDGGVRLKEIDYTDNHWHFIDLENVFSEQQARQLIEKYLGQKYDLLGNLRFGFGLIPQSRRRWFCSEIVAEALGMTESWRYGPNGLYQALTFALKEARNEIKN